MFGGQTRVLCNLRLDGDRRRRCEVVQNLILEVFLHHLQFSRDKILIIAFFNLFRNYSIMF